MSAFTPEAIVMLVTALTVGVVIVFHYEVIQLLNRWSVSYTHLTLPTTPYV